MFSLVRSKSLVSPRCFAPAQSSTSVFAALRWAVSLSLLLLTAASAQAPSSGKATRSGASGVTSPKGKPAGAPLLAPALISELRAYGPTGDDDAFVEIVNTTAQPLSLGGWSVQYLNPKKQLVVVPIRAGIIVPPQGHLLLVGKKYSLKAYAIGDLQLTDTIASGVRLCDVDGQVVDSVGPQTVGESAIAGNPVGEGVAPVTPPTTALTQVFGEGRGVSLTAFESPTLHAGSKAQFSCVRRHLVGQTTLQDNNDNAADFFVVSVDGVLDEEQVRLGAPGPQNLLDSRLDYPLRPQSTKPKEGDAKNVATKSGAPASKPPSITTTQGRKDEGIVVHATSTLSGKLPRLRNTTATSANQRYGTLTLRYELTNETEQTIKRFSLAIVGITAGGGPQGTADLRLLTPPSVKRLAARGKEAVTLPPAKAGALNTALNTGGAKPLPILYGILDEPPTQKEGGGLNSSITFEAPQGIAPGKTVELRFLLGVEEKGRYLVTVDGVGLTTTFSGDTETGDGTWRATTRSEEGSTQQRLAMNPGQGGQGSMGTGGSPTGGNQNKASVQSPANAGPVQIASIIVVGNTEDETDAPPPVKSPLGLSSSAADSATNVVSLRFTGPLDRGSASNAGNFSISTQDGIIAIEKATYSEGDQSITLTLPEGSLHRGDKVIIKWNHLRDAQGRETSGQVGPITVL